MKKNIIQPQSASTFHHYQNISEQYNDIVFCDEAYRQWGVELIIQALALTPSDVVVDLGGGIGIYSHMVYAAVSLKTKVLCVDMCNGMLERIHLPGVSKLCADAMSFAQRKGMGYDKIYIKESIHHFSQRVEIFTGIYQQLSPGGRLLITTRPQTPGYPFFQAAMERFAQEQPCHEVIKTELETVGFVVDMKCHQYPLEFKKISGFICSDTVMSG